MAHIREVRLIDDLDGEKADETIEFGIDGKNYQIDLSEANAGKLRGALASYVAAARRTGGRRRGSSSAGSPAVRSSTASRTRRSETGPARRA